ncbi:MAG: PilZ domain-containing protein [Desulfobacterales bacterium]|nr:PilZ domain-containing protein [Desulfobacterales bacterium]
MNQKMLAKIFGEQEAKEIEDLIEKEVKYGIDKLSPLAYRLYGLLVEAFMEHDDESSLGVYADSLAESLDMDKDAIGSMIPEINTAVDEINIHTPLLYQVEVDSEIESEKMTFEFSRITDETYEKYKGRIPGDQAEPTAAAGEARAGEPTVEEKRKSPRKQGFVPVEYTTHDLSDSAVVKDISIDGVFIETAETFEIGQEFILHIPFSDSRDQVKLQVEVVHVSPLGIGTKFKEILTPQEPCA